jgi:hypothetical protein
MDNITKQINAESANQELQIQLIKAQKYQTAFEQLVKEIEFCAHMNTIVAWKTLPYVLSYIKEKNNIKT